MRHRRIMGEWERTKFRFRVLDYGAEVAAILALDGDGERRRAAIGTRSCIGRSRMPAMRRIGSGR
jgi:hypothetical protein